MDTFVKSVSATAIHGRFDLHQEFNDSVNILFGKNGAGKTTLLHILANILAGDYAQFVHLMFRNIEVCLSNGAKIKIERLFQKNSREIRAYIDDLPVAEYSLVPVETSSGRTQYRLVQPRRRTDEPKPRPPLQTAYFPAFRSVIEAGTSALARYHELHYYPPSPWIDRADESVTPTEIARALFGPFVPSISYPSTEQIEQRLVEEAKQALIIIGQADQRVLSKALVELFAKILEDPSPHSTNTDPPEKILAEIKMLSEKLRETPFDSGSSGNLDYSSYLNELVHASSGKGTVELAAVRMLNTYRNSLQDRALVQQKAYENIHRYLTSVNDFLDNKQLTLHRNISEADTTSSDIEVRISYEGQTTRGTKILSSGERQILTLLYAATHMSSQEVVLIDEPEISLHVDWQRLLLRKMSEQLGTRQIIVCTHSPIIGADYEEYLMELNLVRTKTLIPAKETEIINEDFFAPDEIPF